MRIENFPKLKQSDHNPKRDEFIDVSSDPSYFSLDSLFIKLFMGKMAFLAIFMSLSMGMRFFY
jgi:hypothetical protein